VDNFSFVGGADRIGERNGNLEELLEGHSLIGNEVRKRFPLHQFHRDEVDAVRLFDGVDSNNVGVVQGGERFSFALKPGPTPFVLG